MGDIIGCNAPCIINTASGFHLVFCEGDAGHSGYHFRKIKDRHTGVEGAIGWDYLSVPSESESDVPSLSGSKRCMEWMHLLPLPKIVPGSLEPRRDQTLINVVSENFSSTGFCCGKELGHDGQHARSGLFGPLAINWEIVW